ncbi:MAG: outer membrane lipoprotein carrier protein LolA [Alphaproteobacteria bacterium]|nr:outer membrane lipoprotein carrier protein LolA [Alphaproteobacteria bacterium]
MVRHPSLNLGFLALPAALFVAIVFAGAPSSGKTHASANLSATDKTDIARIERYLNNISTMRARFLQVAANDELSQGWVFLSRPGKLRVEYDPPTPILIIGDGAWLIYHDSELEQTTYRSLESSLVGFLVQKTVRLGGAVTVTGLERGPGVIRVKLVKSGEAEEGSLALTFSDRPLVLRQWTVTDAEGQATQIALLNAQFGLSLDEALFEFTESSEDGGVSR